MPEKRIRLSLGDIKMIDEALRFYEEQTKGKIYDEPDWQKKTTTLSNLRRRFSCLAENDGFYARRSR